MSFHSWIRHCLIYECDVFTCVSQIPALPLSDSHGVKQTVLKQNKQHFFTNRTKSQILCKMGAYEYFQSVDKFSGLYGHRHHVCMSWNHIFTVCIVSTVWYIWIGLKTFETCRTSMSYLDWWYCFPLDVLCPAPTMRTTPSLSGIVALVYIRMGQMG